MPIRNYEESPLIEALCEVRFHSDGEWDWTIPGLFYEKIEKEFPQKIPLKSAEVKFRIGESEENISPDIKHGIAMMQFRRTDESALIQVGPDVLVVNHLKPYPGWSDFKPLILSKLETYNKIGNPTSIQSIGLRYINRIEIPFDEGEETNLEKYFEALPHLPDLIPQTWGEIFMRVDVPYTDDPVMFLRLVFGSTKPSSEAYHAFLLDLNVGNTTQNTPQNENIDSWLEEAHDRLETAFDASFTEITHKEIFREVE